MGVSQEKPMLRYSAPAQVAMRLEEPPAKRFKGMANPFENIPDEGDFPFYSNPSASGPLQATMMLNDAADPFEEGLNVRHLRFLPLAHEQFQAGNLADMHEALWESCRALAARFS